MSALARPITFSAPEKDDELPEVSHNERTKPSPVEATFHLLIGDTAVVVNFGKHGVRVNNQHVFLPDTKQRLLAFLCENVGRLCTKEMILSHLYGDRGKEPELKIIDVFICKLRKKLKPTALSGAINTVWGRGYVLGEYVTKPQLVGSADTTKRVLGPHGTQIGIADLPPQGLVRWVSRKKAELVCAFTNGLLSREEISQRYPSLASEELDHWCGLYQKYGVKGLRTTRLQNYR